jgi:hypothetical protein
VPDILTLSMEEGPQTKITLAGGLTIHVNEAASQVASQLRGKGFVKLQLADSKDIYVNSAQVLYIEDVPDTPPT